MTKTEKLQVATAAIGILYLWRQIVIEAEVQEHDPMRRIWYKLEVRQAYHDALISMRNNHLIEDYDMLELKVKMDGVWTGEILTREFKPKRKRHDHKSRIQG